MMNIKVVRFMVTEKEIEHTSDWVMEALSDRCEWSYRTVKETDYYISVPVLSASKTAVEIVDCLHANGVQYEIDDMSGGYDLWMTHAPECYDYTGFGTMHVGSLRSEKNDLRLVAIPRERADYQIGRYASGLYPAWKL